MCGGAVGKASGTVGAPDRSLCSGRGSAESQARCFSPAQPLLRVSHPRDTAGEGLCRWGGYVPRGPAATLSLGARSLCPPALTPRHRDEASFILKGKEFTSRRPTQTQIQINFSQSAAVGENQRPFVRLTSEEPHSL